MKTIHKKDKPNITVLSSKNVVERNINTWKLIAFGSLILIIILTIVFITSTSKLTISKKNIGNVLVETKSTKNNLSKPNMVSKNASVILYNLPQGWESWLNGHELSEVGFDKKTMTINAITDNGSGTRLTYGSTGELLIYRYLVNSDIATLFDALMASMPNYANWNLKPAGVSKSTLHKEYLITGKPALFLYGFNGTNIDTIGIIGLDEGYFMQFISKDIPKSA